MREEDDKEGEKLKDREKTGGHNQISDQKCLGFCEGNEREQV